MEFVIRRRELSLAGRKIIQCAICGTDTVQMKSEHKYCSNTCRSIGNRRRWKEASKDSGVKEVIKIKKDLFAA